MSDLLYVAIIIADLIVIKDVFEKLQGRVSRALWVAVVLLLPVFGAALWYYVQYLAPAQKRIEKKKRTMR